MTSDEEKSVTNQRKEPLFILGVAVLVVGAALLAYGFVPTQQNQYKAISSMVVPLYDSHGNFILDPSAYFQSHYNGSASVDRVTCSPQSGSSLCYGFQFTGTKTVFSQDSRIYGLGTIAIGLFSVFIAGRYGPAPPIETLRRKYRISVDEDICVANGVCIELAPKVFKFKEQTSPTIFAPMAYVLDPLGADNATILQAAQMCPTGAIVIEDEDTGERIHPPYPKN